MLYAVMVTSEGGDDAVDLFRHVYASPEAAKRAVEAHAVERWEFTVDPNSDVRQAFPGLDWEDLVGCIDIDDCTVTYEITPVEVATD